MNTTEMRALADQLDQVEKECYSHRYQGAWAKQAGASLRQLANSIDNPAGDGPFDFTTSATVALAIRLSDTMKDRFEGWASKSEIHYRGGGGMGSGNSWSMSYYFTDENSLRRAVGWLLEQGATKKTVEQVEAECETAYKASVAKAFGR